MLSARVIPVRASGEEMVSVMRTRDPVKNFEVLWETFRARYPFFTLRKVDWQQQYDTFRPLVSGETRDGALFDILCRMVDPLDDGHVEIEGRVDGKMRRFTAEKPTRFHREFAEPDIKRLFKVTERTLVAQGFEPPRTTAAWMLRYGRSGTVGYLRVLELEGISTRKLRSALDRIARDFADLRGFIIDIRDNPGGDDSTALAIINRFCDRERVAFHRKTKIGPGDDDWSPLKTWHMAPEGDAQFTGPIVLLTCDAVFSGGEAFALAIKELPYVTIVGDHTNGIFSYTLEKTLPNGWEYCLSYQMYLSADMVCPEGRGVAPDIPLLNSKADLASGVDPLITRALAVLEAGGAVA